MHMIRADIEVLRDKANECERAANFAIDSACRAINRKRAKLYRELVDEAELRYGEVSWSNGAVTSGRFDQAYERN